MCSPLVRAVPFLALTAALASADPRATEPDAPTRATPAAPEGSYLVITDAPMLGAFQRFVAWKRRRGVDAHLLEMSAIRRRHPAARDEAERVRLAIRDAHAAGVRWVLLGGDTEVIPTRILHTEALGLVDDYACDFYYADLQGDWDADGDGVFGEGERSVEEPGDGVELTADVHIGRAPVRSAREAMAFVEKTIRHAERSRAGEVLIAAEVLFPGLDLAPYAERLLPHFDAVPGVTVERLYESADDPAWRPGARPLSQASFLAALAAGPELVIPMAGGDVGALGVGEDLLTPPELAVLEDTKPAGVMWATLPAKTHDIEGDAVAEAWMRVPHGGVVASVGTSTWNLVGLGNARLDQSVRAFTAERGGIVGVLLERHRAFHGRPVQEEAFGRAQALSLILLGDPQVELELGAAAGAAALAATSAAPAPRDLDDPSSASTTTGLHVPSAPSSPDRGIADAGAVLRATPAPARDHCELRLGRAVAGNGILIFDVVGRVVRRVEADTRGVARWDLADRTGHRVREGVYFARPSSDPAAPVTRIVVAP